MTSLVYDDSLWMWKCENCNGKMSLPGIAPSVKMLVQSEWNYCPHCGEQIDYDKMQTDERIAEIKTDYRQEGR